MGRKWVACRSSWEGTREKREGTQILLQAYKPLNLREWFGGELK